jgi:hypothetical protein
VGRFSAAYCTACFLPFTGLERMCWSNLFWWRPLSFTAPTQAQLSSVQPIAPIVRLTIGVQPRGFAHTIKTAARTPASRRQSSRRQFEMPPFYQPSTDHAQNTTFNGSFPINATCRKLVELKSSANAECANMHVADNTALNQVSWQSAYWPVMACTLVVLLQETGRVCNGPYRYSYASRSSPFVCALDTFMMLLKLVVLLTVGCSPLIAVRYVWYDRFEREEISGGEEPTDISVNAMGPVASHGTFDASGEGDTCSGALSSAELAEAEGRDVADLPLTTLDTLNTASASETEGIVTEAERDLRDPDLMTGAAPSSNSTIHGEQHQELERASTMTTTRPAVSNTIGPLLIHLLVAVPAETPTNMTSLPGSTVDRTWRLSMVSFIFGALPQAVKVFGMRGVPFTQTIVAISITSFIVAEVFRSVASPVGAVDLHPMSVVVNAKNFLSGPLILIYTVLTVGLCTYMVWFTPLLLTMTASNSRFRMMGFSLHNCFGLAVLITHLLLVFSRYFATLKVCASFLRALRAWVAFPVSCVKVRRKLALFVSNLFVLDSSVVDSWLLFTSLCSLILALLLWIALRDFCLNFF